MNEQRSLLLFPRTEGTLWLFIYLPDCTGAHALGFLKSVVIFKFTSYCSCLTFYSCLVLGHWF